MTNAKKYNGWHKERNENSYFCLYLTSPSFTLSSETWGLPFENVIHNIWIALLSMAPGWKESGQSRGTPHSCDLRMQSPPPVPSCITGCPEFPVGPLWGTCLKIPPLISDTGNVLPSAWYYKPNSTHPVSSEELQRKEQELEGRARLHRTALGGWRGSCTRSHYGGKHRLQVQGEDETVKFPEKTHHLPTALPSSHSV